MGEKIIAIIITVMFIMLTAVSCGLPDIDSRCIKMAALGRPLYPGMLYDYRTDNFIPGVRLWDETKLNKELDVHHQPTTNLKFAASDTLRDKANLLDISASLKASFLGGLVEVGGSAKYLHDTKSSTHQCRVTMHYSQTTTFAQLTINELGTFTYPQVFDKQTATHVVTAVLYGAQAFMVFDYMTAGNERKQEIEGKLDVMVKKLNIDGKAAVHMTEKEKNMTEKISVTFYGDFKLDQNPTTYKEAMEVYKKLPTLMKQGNSKDVPLTVWLYPLSLLDDKAAKLEREISISLVHKTENMLEELGEVERSCNDLKKNPIIYDFPDLKDRFLKFQAFHSFYKTSFHNKLFSVLPAIRRGALEKKALGDILNIHYSSPFTVNNMANWLDDFTTELNILSSYTSGLKDLTVVQSSGSLNSILFDPDVDVVVCLSFTSLKYKDSYLASLQDFDNSTEFTALISEKHSSLKATQPWYASPDISERMKQNLFLFTSFSKANKKEKRIKFIIASISDPSNPGASIRLYKNGLLKNPKFQPVSKPPLPVVEPGDEKVILKLSKSPTGETDQFRVEYRSTPPTDSAAHVDAWNVINTSNSRNSFTLTGLKPGEQYWVRYRAVNDLLVSEASDPVPFTFQGKIRFTLGQSWDFSMPSFFNEIRTKIMSSMSMSRWSLSTIKSEVINVVNSPIIPYTKKIPGGLRAGMALYIQGVVFATGKSFILDVMMCNNIAFHFRAGTDNWITCDSRTNGYWDKKERTPGCQISKGSAFDIFIVTKTEGYEVFINGQWSLLFKHRLPVKSVTAFHIHGDVIMNTFGIVSDWRTSSFAKELNSGSSRTKLSSIQSDVSKPVCSPIKPYLGKIPGGLRPGVALFFQGVVPSDCERFEINLQTGLTYLNDDIAFHFNPRMDSVVLNSYRNGSWEDEVIEGSPFVKGGAFDIIMVTKPEGYGVIVNGLEFCTFNHRTPVDKVTILDIRGDVFMNTFGIIEWDVNLKLTIPANI